MVKYHEGMITQNAIHKRFAFNVIIKMPQWNASVKCHNKKPTLNTIPHAKMTSRNASKRG